MIITLTSDIENALTRRAHQTGISPEEIALNILRNQVVPQWEEKVSAKKNMTMYEVLQDYIGVIDSREYVPGGANMSQDCGEKFAEGQLEKRKQGRL